MQKSHRMLEPRRQPPKWGNPRAMERITTDDAVFELCLTTESNTNKGELMVAYKSRGLWQQAMITKSRIKRREVFNT